MLAEGNGFPGDRESEGAIVGDGAEGLNNEAESRTDDLDAKR
jgi:hypothetical protein